LVQYNKPHRSRRRLFGAGRWRGGHVIAGIACRLNDLLFSTVGVKAASTDRLLA